LKQTPTRIHLKQSGRATAATKGTRRFQSAALQYTYDRYIGHDPKRIEEYQEELLNAEIARRIYELRTKAGLSQRELAKKIGTTASTICRLEDSDYDGHSLSLLKRIAEALGKRVEIRFMPAKRLRTA
jgi:DNA-binding XRE family transcriptional regulator